MSDVEEDDSDDESVISELNGDNEYEEFDENPDELEGDDEQEVVGTEKDQYRAKDGSQLSSRNIQIPTVKRKSSQLDEPSQPESKKQRTGTMRKNKPEIPSEFLPSRKRAEGSSLVGHDGNKTMTSLACGNNKAVIFLTTNPDLEGEAKTAKGTTKPAVNIHYNYNKAGVDVLDQITKEFSLMKPTRRIIHRLNDGELQAAVPASPARVLLQWLAHKKSGICKRQWHRVSGQIQMHCRRL
ncbi:conserved hypothetical protein [Culex quinquefasciatus]|uniref:PiggyBac transposable element-derived protein domain-containing protein n=1 Tax=Culex quinquefasciatus TaxID=7176 RepID=B0XA76_CULQU|nr:conserved hypothetical protein [Culex quinquefasciatus]|eukprot:XP_001866548.1 conserved hypothetical protein [Culex quinquefasciatus]